MLEMSVSYWVARKTKIWHGVDVKYQKKITLKPHLILEHIKCTTKDLDFYKRKSIGSFYLTYEQLFGKNGIDQVESCLRFFGAKINNLSESQRLLQPQMRQNQKPWCDIIENWDEIIYYLDKNNCNFHAPN